MFCHCSKEQLAGRKMRQARWLQKGPITKNANPNSVGIRGLDRPNHSHRCDLYYRVAIVAKGNWWKVEVGGMAAEGVRLQTISVQGTDCHDLPPAVAPKTD
jgi:hypothetical protein